MKVLLVSDFYPPQPGGLEAHVARLARHLVRRGHEVTVATVSGCGESDSGVDVHELDLSLGRFPVAYATGRSFHPPWTDRRFATSLRHLINQLNPDVVHAHGWCVFSAAAIAGRAGVPVVTTLHDYGLLCSTRSLCGEVRADRLARWCCASGHLTDQGLLKRLGLAAAIRAGRRRISAQVQRFIAVSSFVSTVHRRAGIGGSQGPEIVPNFIDVVDEHPTDPPLDGPILFVGPRDPHKGRRVVEAAYRQLVEAGFNGDLHLVGGTRRSRPVDGVTHRGRLSGLALWETYRSASVVVVPSVWADPCPTVALEAMAMGRPVIAAAVGGLPDIVRANVTGLLVPPADPSALAEAIGEVIARPRVAAAMGRAGRDRVSASFSASSVVPRIESIYAEVCA